MKARRAERCAIIVPDLGLPGVSILVSVWLVPLGTAVSAGERLVELLVGDAIVDLAAPADGVLRERVVLEDEPVEVGQVLGWIKIAAG
jgi:pyruvate/2-oxoglutarate dehydrogenase complex dihydrolipoamide acyltransferase (E2) component